MIEWHGSLSLLPSAPAEVLAAYAAVGPAIRDRKDKSYQRPLKVRGQSA